ncbi:CHASE domain-containing protein [Methyloversatilis discipulorum]|uniref:CHASE domain-containing protein n=1 Tax=Methyloversatilis discipulorum TaxID=1119528 RepID=UPI0026F0F936|nr:CHASE domain-containing protein [Methyloversatilis discipulorum]
MSAAPDTRASTDRSVWQIGLPVLLATLGATLAVYLVWNEMDRRHRERVDERLAFVARDITQQVEQRMRAYRQVLRGARALFDASDEVTHEDWKTYVGQLSLQEDFPGIQGVGFSAYVKAEDLDSHVASMRARGQADYGIRPPGERPEYSSIVYLEPQDWRNQRAISFDMLSEPVRREAMQRAGRTGEAALTGKVRLIQEADRDIQTGVLLYLPAYRRGLPTGTEAERAAALSGWVYSPFRMLDLMAGTLGRMQPALRLRIYDGGTAEPEALLFDSHGTDPVRFDAPTHSISRDIDGRRWLLVFEQRQEAAADVDRWRTELALVVLFGALVVALTASLGLARRRAARLAELGASLARSEALYSTLVNLSGESILALDARGHIEYANPGLHRMLNLDARDVGGRSLGELAFDGNRHALQSMADALLGGDTVRMELTLQSRDRGEVAVLASGVPRTDSAGRVTGAIIVMADISERKADEARIAWLATHDSLTGLPNRSLLVERLNRTLASAKRYRRRFCLLFIDLDHFKEVNDRMGHHAGDEVLIEASRRMLACLRAADTLARHGGDEFVALLPETGSIEAACAVAEKIRLRLGEPFTLEQGLAQISASLGVVMCPDHGDDFDTLVARADQAMYAAKAAGRNTIAVWTAPDNKDKQ